MRSPHRSARARRRALTLTLTTAVLLGSASTALADTTALIKNGELFVRDTVSLFDERMDVVVKRDDGDLLVTDAVGNMHVGTGCQLSGAAARCNDNVSGVRFEAGTKNDRLVNDTDLSSVMLGNKGVDFMRGGAARDEMNGEEGNDDLYGGGGPDVFFKEDGSDHLDGQDGTDTVSYSAAPAKVSIQLDDTAANDGIAGEADRLLDVENARGSAFGDNVDGSDEANVLNGLGGNDHIRGRNGDDRMIGGDGADILDGDDAVDTADYTDRTAGVVVDIDDVADDGSALDGPANARDNVLSQTENILGGSGNDNLNGHPALAVANTLDGNIGDDTLRGREGDDVLEGDVGNDVLEGEAGADTLRGGIFNDTLNGGPDADTLNGDGGDDALDGGQGPDLLDGGDNRDHLDYSSRVEDILVTLDSVALDDDGGASDDAGGQRDDARNIEKITTGTGDDRVEGDGSDEEFVTREGADTLTGNAGRDVLVSGSGMDVLVGDAGDDKLVGGPDQDAFDGGLDSDFLDTVDGGIDQPISCGEGPIEDFQQDFPSVDDIVGDVADLQANPAIVEPGNPAECEIRTFS